MLLLPHAASPSRSLTTGRGQFPALLSAEVRAWREFAAHVEACSVCRLAAELDAGAMCGDGVSRMGVWDAAEAAVADVLLPDSAA